jgi:hypothetical protein
VKIVAPGETGAAKPSEAAGQPAEKPAEKQTEPKKK